jgi:predicted nucleic acid-binding protein
LIVVSDTSPILNLARIGRLELLPGLYQQVFVPSKVHGELMDSLGAVSLDLASFEWLVVASPEDRSRVEALSAELDPGEAEAIVLALERHADLLFVDERRGRRIARTTGLRVTGLIGVLTAAKGAGLIDAVKPVLDALIRDARFWIGRALYREVLTHLGEL